MSSSNFAEMHKYFIKTPWIAKKVFSSYIWSLPADNNEVYLTFDDGPHPTITPWVLNELKNYNAEATFFCIGNNVERYPDVYQKILEEGHATGNHTYHHLNGWKNEDEQYIADVSTASQLIKSNLFRPPYGRIKNSQAKKISNALQTNNARIIMWDVLSADFDSSFTKEQCLNNVLQNVSAGSIIVFHDSEKAFVNLEFVLPETLKSLNGEGYRFKKIEL
jgi:peptidoglycan/xylan/chitin deacetylase (PgdA/CDA1 family)